MAVAFDQDLGTSTGATPVTNAFELLIALLSLIAAVGFFLYPESLYRSSVGRALHPYDYAWDGALRLAGVAIVLGILMPRPRIRCPTAFRP